MDMETEFRVPYFCFSSLAHSMLNGSGDKLNTTEQIKEGVTCGAVSSEARWTRVQILPLPTLNCVTSAGY